jgi:hypothetical protein
MRSVVLGQGKIAGLLKISAALEYFIRRVHSGILFLLYIKVLPQYVMGPKAEINFSGVKF